MTAGDGHDSWWWSDHTSATGNTTASTPQRLADGGGGGGGGGGAGPSGALSAGGGGADSGALTQAALHPVDYLGFQQNLNEQARMYALTAALAPVRYPVVVGGDRVRAAQSGSGVCADVSELV